MAHFRPRACWSRRATIGYGADQPRCWSTGTSSGNCQETETHVVRACHTPRQPLQNHSSRRLRGWATLWSAEEILEGQRQKVDIPAHARTAHNEWFRFSTNVWDDSTFPSNSPRTLTACHLFLLSLFFFFFFSTVFGRSFLRPFSKKKKKISFMCLNTQITQHCS